MSQSSFVPRVSSAGLPWTDRMNSTFAKRILPCTVVFLPPYDPVILFALAQVLNWRIIPSRYAPQPHVVVVVVATNM